MRHLPIPRSLLITISGVSTGLTTTASSHTVSLTGTLDVANGGTGDSSFTVYAAICGGTTTTGTLQSASTGISNSGYVLTSTGAASLPTFQAPAASSISITGDSGGALTGNSFTFTGGTTGLTFAGAGSTETLGGTLNVAHGGTGANTFTAHSLLLGQGTSAVTALVASTYVQIPIGSTGADPVLATITAGANITVTNGAGTITIAANASSASFNYTSVNHAASPYTALSTDYYIRCFNRANYYSL